MFLENLEKQGIILLLYQNDFLIYNMPPYKPKYLYFQFKKIILEDEI